MKRIHTERRNANILTRKNLLKNQTINNCKKARNDHAIGRAKGGSLAQELFAKMGLSKLFERGVR